MVDDSREEHRMLIFGNDSDPVQAHLIAGEVSKAGMLAQNGILEQKEHTESYTVTLYAVLKDYGLTPVVRIKPRIRFHRSNYDNLSSSAPLQYSLDDIVDFAELKRGIDVDEKVARGHRQRLAKIFGDAPAIKDLSTDAALQLVAQRDVSLRQPPFKTKTKVFGEGTNQRGIPLGMFLDALNQPKRTESIFKPFPKGGEFAKDLLEAISHYEHLEFQFGLYSRYERRDCVLAGQVDQADGYRTTFDPWTALGYIRSDGNAQQLQILSHERGTRWEHKIMPEDMDKQTLKLISGEIRSLRRHYLIGRILSKSQTALTLLARSQESKLNLTKDLFVDYELKIEVPIGTDRFSDIGARRKLRAIFNSGHSQYHLHPFNSDFVERHSNVAKGLRAGVVYTLDNVYLMQGAPAKQQTDDGMTVIRAPIHERVVMRSAQHLRDRIPENGFEECWNEVIDEGGYNIINKRTGRSYTISYGRRCLGSVHDGTESKQNQICYLVIKYLGIVPERYANTQIVVDSKRTFDPIRRKEYGVIQEMKNIVSFLKKRQQI